MALDSNGTLFTEQTQNSVEYDENSMDDTGINGTSIDTDTTDHTSSAPDVDTSSPRFDLTTSTMSSIEATDNNNNTTMMVLNDGGTQEIVVDEWHSGWVAVLVLTMIGITLLLVLLWRRKRDYGALGLGVGAHPSSRFPILSLPNWSRLSSSRMSLIGRPQHNTINGEHTMGHNDTTHNAATEVMWTSHGMYNGGSAPSTTDAEFWERHLMHDDYLDDMVYRPPTISADDRQANTYLPQQSRSSQSGSIRLEFTNSRI